VRVSIGDNFLKQEASTLTRLMRRCTMRSSFSTSYPKMVTCPLSGMSSVDKMRIKVDLPEPFEPRIPTISRRSIVMVTLSTARTSRFSSFFLRQPNKGRGFLNILVTPSMTTAFFVTSIARSSIGCISTCIATGFISSFWTAKEPCISLSIMHLSGWYIDRLNRLRPVQAYKYLDSHRHFLHSWHISPQGIYYSILFI